MNRFVIAEPKHCIGCNTCMAACSAAHRAQGLQSSPRLTLARTIHGSAPILCRHCEEAPCAQVCPVNAIAHDVDRIVVNEQNCIGCKMCALACPFGAITPAGTTTAGVAGVATATPTNSAALNPLLVWEVGVRSVAVKCDLCGFAPDGPSCVKVCPTKALFVVDPGTLTRANKIKREADVAWQGNGPAGSAIEERV